MSKKILLLSFLVCGLLLGTACSSDDSSPKKEEPNPDDDGPVIEEPAKTGTFNYTTFKDVKVGFGDGLSQSAEGTFTFPTDIEKVQTIKIGRAHV